VVHTRVMGLLFGVLRAQMSTGMQPWRPVEGAKGVLNELPRAPPRAAVLPPCNRLEPAQASASVRVSGYASRTFSTVPSS
jgi:hypothetical protein